jgi:hypothetical protein
MAAMSRYKKSTCGSNNSVGASTIVTVPLYADAVTAFPELVFAWRDRERRTGPGVVSVVKVYSMSSSLPGARVVDSGWVVRLRRRVDGGLSDQIEPVMAERWRGVGSWLVRWRVRCCGWVFVIVRGVEGDVRARVRFGFAMAETNGRRLRPRVGRKAVICIVADRLMVR